MASPVYLYDGILELDGGMNSGVESQLLDKNELAFLTNGFLDTGFITHRPPTNKLAITANDAGTIQAATKGWFYGATCYTSDAGVPSILASIGGQLFRFTPQYQPNPFNANLGVPLNEVVVDNQTGNSPGMDTATALQHWLRQAERWVIWHDAINLPLFWDGSATPPTIRRSAGSSAYPPELPAGRMLTYGLGRVWQSLPDGVSFMAGDIVNWSSGTLAYNFRDAVLKASSNQLLAGGGTFRVPGNVGTIQALVFVALLDASLGQGPLQVLAQQTVFSCNAPVDQSTWQSLTNPILTESVKAAGGTAQDSTILANGDIIYRSPDAQIRSLILARLDFNRWGNSPMSLEVTRIIEDDNPALLPFGSGVNFDNGALLTTGPVVGPLGVYHTGLVSLTFDLVSLMREKFPPAYNGLWTGWKVLSLVTGMFYNVQRSFAFVYNSNTNAIELHEFLPSTTNQFADNGSTPITMQFESAALFWKLKGKSEFDMVKLEAGEMAVQEIQGFTTFNVEFKSVYDPYWHPWISWSVDNTNGKTPYAPRMGLGIPPTTNNCNPATKRPYEVDYAFQVRVTITGKCRFMGLRLKASLMPQSEFAAPFCPPAFPVPPPGDPTDLQATVSGNEVILTWNASSGAGVTYTIYRDTTPGFTPGPSNQIATGVTGTSYTDLGTAPGTTYYYTVTANNPAGHSHPAQPAHITHPGPLTNGLVAYYKLDEVSGSRFDVNGANPLIETGDPSPSVPGIIGLAMQLIVAPGFSPLTANTFPYAPYNFSGPVSVSCWIQTTGPNTPWMYYGDPADSNSCVWGVSMGPSGNPNVYMPNGAGSLAASSVSLSDGLWHHVVCTADATGLNIYVDGVLGAFPGVPPTFGVPPNTWTFQIAGQTYAPINVDEVGIWNRALTQADVTNLYNGGAGKTYPF